MPDNTPKKRGQGAWVAPLVGTVLTLPVGLIALAVGGLSPMACDSCEDADAARFDTSFDTAFTVLQLGLAASLALLIAGWCLIGDERAERRWLFALLPIGTVLISLMLFLSLVDWPS